MIFSYIFFIILNKFKILLNIMGFLYKYLEIIILIYLR